MNWRRNILLITLFCILTSANADTFTNKKTGEQFDGYATKIANRTRLAVRSSTSENIRHIEPADYNIVYNEKGRRKQVYVIDINDSLMLECETEAFEKAIRIAENQGNLAIVLHIDTPGGRVDLMKRYCNAIAAVGVTPVIAVVGDGRNGGAYSAGAIIAMGCDKLIMQNNSAIGAATMVFMDANDGMVSTKEKYGDEVGEKLDSALRAYCASIAEQAGRSGLIAQAMINREFEIVAIKDANDKYKICDSRDLNDNSQDCVVVSRKGSLLTLSAKTAVDIGFADEQIESFNDWKLDCEFADCRWIPSQEIKTARRQYAMYEKRFNAVSNEIQQLGIKISIAVNKNEQARYVFEQRELTNQKIIEVRNNVGKMIGQFKTAISLKKGCADLPVEMQDLESNLQQLKTIHDELTSMMR